MAVPVPVTVPVPVPVHVSILHVYIPHIGLFCRALLQKRPIFDVSILHVYACPHASIACLYCILDMGSGTCQLDMGSGT